MSSLQRIHLHYVILRVSSFALSLKQEQASVFMPSIDKLVYY